MACGMDIVEHLGEGFMPVVDFGEWRVAIMNDAKKNRPEGISYIERHNETDECFILLEGKCTLFYTDKDPSGELECVHMEIGKVYNVRKGVWHTNMVYEGTKILIVENRNTSKLNSEYFRELSEAQKRFFIENAK